MAKQAYDKGFQDSAANRPPPKPNPSYPADVQEAYKTGYQAGRSSRGAGAGQPAAPAAAPAAPPAAAPMPAAFSFQGGPLIQAAERKAYDAGFRAGAENQPPPAGQNAPPVIRQAYAQGYAAGMASRTRYPVGAIYAKLPAANCSMPVVQGRTYYYCDNTWFQPSFGANGVYYRVVAAP
jgi:hypothetical protein